MPIPNPSLDDLTFEQLVEEAKRSIPLFTKSWTNFNLSDPGITLLELFAWLTENQIYTLNKITKRNYSKFLKLLGIIPSESDPTTIDLTIFIKRYSMTDNNNTYTFILPKRTPFSIKEEEILVETEEEICIIPSLQINRCIVYSNNSLSEVKLANPISDNVSSSSFVSNNSSSTPMPEPANAVDNNLHSHISSESFFLLFGEDPKNKDCFYLKMEFSPQHIIKGYEISLSFYLFEKDLPPKGQHGSERPEDFISKDFHSRLLWEYALAEDNNVQGSSTTRNIIWSPLKVEDGTSSFSKSGRVRFQYPTDRTREKFDLFKELLADNEKGNHDQDINNKGELWIRCRIIKQNFHFIPPRVELILPNTVSCSIGYTIKRNLKNKSPLAYRPKEQDNTDPNEFHYQEMSNGLSNQIFEIETDLKFPILKLNYLNIREREWNNRSKKWKWQKSEKWEKVDDLVSSRPYDKHYVIIDSKKGLIKFGDGENGEVPPKGSKIEAEYKFGNMQHWWIEQGKHFRFDEHQMKEENSSNFTSPLFHRLSAINFFPSSVGRKAETIRESIIRARQELIVPFKAVSKSDYEYLAKNTPGLRVEKARAMMSNRPGEENMLIIAAVPYSLLPFSKRLDSNQDFRDAIRLHLEKHKLITTRIRVVETKYIGISVNTRIKLTIKSPEHVSIIKKRIAKSLESYFSPLPLEQPIKEGSGWDFGRNVYRSKIIAIIQSLPEVDTVLELDLQGSGGNGFHADIDGNIIMDELNLVYLKDIFISFIQ